MFAICLGEALFATLVAVCTASTVSGAALVRGAPSILPSLYMEAYTLALAGSFAPVVNVPCIILIGISTGIASSASVPPTTNVSGSPKNGISSGLFALSCMYR